MSKRINIVLPERTLTALDRVAPRVNRSQFIAHAVTHYIENQGRKTLRERLRQEALSNAARDLEIATEWFPLEEDVAMRAPVAAKRRSKPRSAKIA